MTVDNRLRTIAAAGSLTSHISVSPMNQTVFTALGTFAFAGAASPVVPLFLQNTDPSLFMVLDRVLVEIVGAPGAGTALPNASDFFSLGFGRTLSAGVTTATPINLNRISTKVANVTALQNNPTLAGTFVESHRWYPLGNGTAFELIRPETDDIILGRNNTLEVRFTSDATAGTVMALIKFFMAADEHMP